MITFPNAKINLGLDVVSKRPDGYHNLETIFYPIPLQDILEITLAEDAKDDTPAVQFTMHNAVFEGDTKKNLVERAYDALAKDFALPKVVINLYKNIPTGAGLGGGSADAAFALKMIKEIANLPLTDEQLEEYAARIGADCAFFIKNRPAYATGIGNILTPTPCSLEGYCIVLIKPHIHISTKEAYAHVTPSKPAVQLEDIAPRPINMWRSSMKNDFERSVFAKHPETAQIKEYLYNIGALYASMSGSGSAFFGIFENEQDIKSIQEAYPDAFCWTSRL